MPARDSVCHECDLLVAVPVLHEGEQAVCPRCGDILAQLPKYPLQRPLVYALTSLIMLACANFLPFLAINAKGLANSMSLFQAASVLFSEEYRVLSVVVYLCMQLLPLACLLLICYLYLGFRLWRGPPPWAATVCRGLFMLLPWSMVEVFLVGVLVSLIKIASLAEVAIGYGFWCFCVFCVMYLKSMLHLDRGWMWDRIRGPMPDAGLLHEGQTALIQGVTLCHGCNGVLSIEHKQCPRCGAAVHARTPHSLEYCVALLVTACILYIPANMLPIMVTESLGSETYSTILGGVVLLWNMGSYPIALVIFVASVLVPITKILALFWLCYSVSRGDCHHRRGRTRIYRLTEFVGRWSMVDVFVVAILVALIRMGKIMSIYPGSAAMAFAAVVVVTMVAAMLFDPRLIWDSTSSDKDTHSD
ncbi:MAG: PqiA/YebS family transporter subunit [Aeromonadaceae bacterium]